MLSDEMFRRGGNLCRVHFCPVLSCFISLYYYLSQFVLIYRLLCVKLIYEFLKKLVEDTAREIGIAQSGVGKKGWLISQNDHAFGIRRSIDN